ncbi:MAG: cell division protein SepF [Clostridiales bacterium]|nr:cell division protein SepF [Clostridiales bacterium]
MGSISEFFKSMITPEESYEEYEDENMYTEYGTENFAEETAYDPVTEATYDEIPYQEPQQQAFRGPVAVQSPVVPSQSAVVIMLTPYDIRTSQVVCDHIKQGHIVICNLTSSANNQRVVDYISGSVYALDGKIEPTPVKTTFVCTPKNVDLIVDSAEESVSGTKVSAL